MIFLLDENVPIPIKDSILEFGLDVFILHDFDMLGVRNGEVAKLALKEKAIIIILNSDFLELNKNLQKKIYISLSLRLNSKI